MSNSTYDLRGIGKVDFPVPPRHKFDIRLIALISSTRSWTAIPHIFGFAVLYIELRWE